MDSKKEAVNTRAFFAATGLHGTHRSFKTYEGQSDAVLLMIMKLEGTLNGGQILEILKIQRGQRYRRLQRLVKEGLIQETRGKTRDGNRKVYSLTTFGKIVAGKLQKIGEFKNFRYNAPEAIRKTIDEAPDYTLKTLPVTRESIWDVLDDAEFIDDEDEVENDFVDDDDDDEEFDLKNLINKLRNKNDNDS